MTTLKVIWSKHVSVSAPNLMPPLVVFKVNVFTSLQDQSENVECMLPLATQPGGDNTFEQPHLSFWKFISTHTYSLPYPDFLSGKELISLEYVCYITYASYNLQICLYLFKPNRNYVLFCIYQGNIISNISRFHDI